MTLDQILRLIIRGRQLSLFGLHFQKGGSCHDEVFIENNSPLISRLRSFVSGLAAIRVLAVIVISLTKLHPGGSVGRVQAHSTFQHADCLLVG